jgi:hypothetical protein
VPQVADTTYSQLTALLIAGAVLGLTFTAIAYVLSRYTRQILFAGLIVVALAYIAFCVDAREPRVWLGVELAGVGVYGAMGFRGLSGSAWWLVAGWALHPLWDVGLHLWGPGRWFAPVWYSIPCVSFDLVVAACVAYTIVRESPTHSSVVRA